MKNKVILFFIGIILVLAVYCFECKAQAETIATTEITLIIGEKQDTDHAEDSNSSLPGLGEEQDILLIVVGITILLFLRKSLIKKLGIPL